eukprot:symbB.v1.2.034988.t1/scaffold4618.1/size37408/1
MSAVTRPSGLNRQSTMRGSTVGRMFSQSVACRTTFQFDFKKRLTNWSENGKEVDLMDVDTEFVKDKELRISFAHRSKLSPFDPSALLPDLRLPLFLVAPWIKKLQQSFPLRHQPKQTPVNPTRYLVALYPGSVSDIGRHLSG